MTKNRLQTAPSTTAAVASAPKVRVLVADADDDTRSLYRTWFEIEGCEVVEATDGREALIAALTEPPSLVVTEIRLPFIDGYALCEILRRDRATTAVPILVITGEARVVESSRARGAGASVVLVKPTTCERLLAESRRLLDDGSAQPADGVDAPPAVTVKPQRRGRAALNKVLPRVSTRTPPRTPPLMICPSCDRRLVYKHSHVGGVSERNSEQWDWYECPGPCGTFEYRHRTRRLQAARTIS